MAGDRSSLQGKFMASSARAFGKLHHAVFKLTGGRVGGTFVAGAPVVFLTTTGRRSGEPRRVPLIYLERDGNLVVAASNGGTWLPAWFRNIEANPSVTIESRRGTEQATARITEDDERDRLWPELVAMYKGYAGYQKNVDYPIPVVILET